MSLASAGSATSPHRPRAIPGPRGYPLLGVLPQLWRDPLRCLMTAGREYGEVVSLPIGTGCFYLVSGSEQIRQILQERHQHYTKPRQYQRFKPIFGEGLITSEGALWRRQRHLAQPAFQRRRRDFFGTVMTAATAAMIERWATAAARAEPINLTEEMVDLTKGVLFKAMFGGTIVDEDDRLTQALYIVEQSVTPVAAVDPFQILIRLPTRANRRMKDGLRTLDELVYGIIEQRRRSPTSGDDFLSLLIAAHDDQTGEGMSDRQLRDEVVTILQAGHEPTAHALTWTFYLLSQSPGVEETLRAELVRVLGARLPTADDLPNLPLTMMVIHEALRLYPPAWVIGRSPIEDEEIGGYHVPANSLIVISPYVTHRLESLWEAPEVFDPERFAPARSAERPRFAYLPFGGGPRLCAGELFALTELPLVVAMVAGNYRLELVPGQRVEPRPLITLRPPERLSMRPYRL